MPTSFTVGGFQTTTYSINYQPRWVGQTYAADLDGDGNDDLVVLGATYPSDVPSAVPQPGLVAFGTGNGAFTLATESRFPVSQLTTVHPREVVFADFNADGQLDVFIGDHGYDASPYPGAQNRLFLSSGNGTWREMGANLPAISDFTHSASAADVDGDGDLDILVGNTPQPNPIAPYVLLNDGSGAFARAELLPTGHGQLLDENNLRILSSLMADLDGDGQVDLVAGAGFSTPQSPKQAQVLWGQAGSFPGAGETALPLPSFFGAQHSVYDIQAVDLNYDGMLDLMLTFQKEVWLGGWEVQVLINQGNRTFADRTASYIPEAAGRNGGTPSSSSAESQYWVQFLHPHDVNGDGRMDFVMDARGQTRAPSQLPAAYIQQADGTFDTVQVADITTSMGWMFDYTTQYANWNGGGGFVHFLFNNGTMEIQVLPVAFDRSSAVSQEFDHPVSAQGTLADDHLYGGRAGDTFAGQGGNDTIAGGGGVDKALYAAARAAYQVSNSNGVMTVRGTGEGTDTLTGVERLVFDDKALAFDLDGNAGMVARIIAAVFGPTTVAARPDYVGIGLALADSGIRDQDLMQLALNVSSGGTQSNETLVRLLYENVVGHAPSEGEVSQYAGMIVSGQFTQASLGVFAAQNVGLIGLAGGAVAYIPA